MKVVIDTSVVMSAIMSKNGRVADVLLNPIFQFQKYSCYFMPIEIFKHKDKLLKYSKLSEIDLLDTLYTALRKIELVNENTITPQNWLLADNLTKDVDNKDVSFVALTIELKATLWTLDKKLTVHLQSVGFQSVVDTQGLIDIIRDQS